MPLARWYFHEHWSRSTAYYCRQRAARLALSLLRALRPDHTCCLRESSRHSHHIYLRRLRSSFWLIGNSLAWLDRSRSSYPATACRTSLWGTWSAPGPLCPKFSSCRLSLARISVWRLARWSRGPTSPCARPRSPCLRTRWQAMSCRQLHRRLVGYLLRVFDRLLLLP